MIALNVFYYAKPGMGKDFLSLIAEEGIRQKCLEEDGCAQYDYFISNENTDLILLVEQWKDKSAQEHHCSTAHMQRIRELKAQYIEKTEIKEY